MKGASRLLAPLPVPPGWPTCAFVRQTRRGASGDQYGSLNLGLHVGDNVASVAANRDWLSAAGIPQVAWLEQVHGRTVVCVNDIPATAPVADAAYTAARNTAVAVMVADCLPVVLTNTSGTRIAVVHCGWRGLRAGVLDAALDAFEGESVLAAFGPAIGPCHYEVGEEVAGHFSDIPGAVQVRAGRIYVDLLAVARFRLRASGVVCGPRAPCTCCARDLYSFRRDGVTGRQAVIAWLRH